MRRSSRIAAVVAAAAVTVAVLGAAPVIAADPSPEASVGPAGDPRVPSGGPSLIGEPGVAIGLVVVVGIGAAAGTLLYVRLTAGGSDRR
jgi:hypothetical protein